MLLKRGLVLNAGKKKKKKKEKILFFSSEERREMNRFLISQTHLNIYMC